MKSILIEVYEKKYNAKGLPRVHEDYEPGTILCHFQGVFFSSDSFNSFNLGLNLTRHASLIREGITMKSFDRCKKSGETDGAS